MSACEMRHLFTACKLVVGRTRSVIASCGVMTDSPIAAASLASIGVRAAASLSLHQMGLRRLPAATGGRGLFALTHFTTGERIFQEQAVLDSQASAAAMSAAFTEAALGDLACSEPIWGLVANYVALLCSSANSEMLRRRAALDAFHRLQVAAPGEEPYRALARHMYAALRAEAKTVVTQDALSDLLNVVRLNAHTVTVKAGGLEGQNIDDGLGLFPLLHLTNHSCDPNAAFSGFVSGSCKSAQAWMKLEASQPIAPSDELSISYLEQPLLKMPVVMRRMLLRRDFGFDCRCERCCSESAAVDVTANTVSVR